MHATKPAGLPKNTRESNMRYTIPVGRHKLRFACLAGFGAVALTISACQDVAAPTSDAAASQSPSPVESAPDPSVGIPDEYIVVLNKDVADVPGRANALVRAHGATLHQTYGKVMKGFSAHMTADQAAELLSDPSVAYVEQDQVMTLTSAGSQVGAPWGLDRIDEPSLPTDGVFNFPSTGAGVNVYILDSGIRHTHTQFGSRVVQAFSAVDDGYGPDGCATHGTRVAGIVGGTTWGVAKDAKLYSVRVTDCAGIATTSTLIAGVEWVTANRIRPAVANMSISGALSGALNSAVTASIATGVTYVTSAANVNADACGFSPGSVAEVITVGAIGGLDAKASYSNFGPCVDLYAPGNDIYSATNVSDVSYALGSGTSEASAFAAGAAALYLELNPTASPAQVQQYLVSGATTGVVTGLTSDTPNRLLRVSSSGSSTTTPPPPGNTAPTASLSGSCQKASCSLDASASRDDAGIVSYSWDFGDGATQTTTTPLTKHVYAAKGNYSKVVKVTVTDAGGLSASAQKTLNIKNGGK
jgi:hypothetical protein